MNNSLRVAAGLVIANLSMTPSPAQTVEPEASRDESPVDLGEATIIGTPGQAQQTTGSAHVIDSTTLQQFDYSDIQRIARQVPGVSVQIEDGYGLRPNLSIRGVATERSARITLLEDNVLIAPAPYSAPSAYYFPTAGRIHGIEVLKGPSAITQGPYTIGGAFNMISTPIPEQREGFVASEAGEDATYRLQATYGDRMDGFGWLVETHQWQSDGYQSIDRSDTDTGLDKEDWMVKLRFEPDSARRQWIDLKFQLAEEDSNQSYLGLTDADFRADPYRRYGLSALDNISTEHQQGIFRYGVEMNQDVTATVTAYYNGYERNWFKTEGIDFDGSDDAQAFSRTSWNSVIQAVNLGESLAGMDAATLQAILEGADTEDGSIQIRSNAREYRSYGIQLGLDWNFSVGQVSHALEFGLRWHEDEEDRLQRNSTYHQEDGRLVLDDLGLLGNAGNRLQEAEAIAFHVYDRIDVGNWTLTPGIRYEDIDQSRIRWETRDGRTDDPSSRAEDNVRDTRANQTDVWLPGFGALYRVSATTSLVGGVHKGFTAPTNSPGVREEESLNWEFGVRYNNGRILAEAIGFYTDYENLLGVCTASSGSDCEIGDAFNGDAATVRGVETRFGMDLSSSPAYSLPLTLTYTHIDGEFDTDVADTDFFGDVSAGDPIPYIPDNQFNGSIGIKWEQWSANLSANYLDEVCTRASCEPFERTDDALIWDASAEYRYSPKLTLFARVENLTGEEDLLGRQPYGARPNKDRTAALGFRFRF